MVDPGFAQRLRSLAAALREGDLARIRVAEPDFEMEVRRSPRFLPAGAIAETAVAETAPPPRPAEIVTSDVVGVLRYLRPPSAEGQSIDGDRELAFVEALGVRNPVRSRGAGRIATVFVGDGSPVEYGQPLYAIER